MTSHPSSKPSSDGLPFVLEAGTKIAGKYVLERQAGFGGMAQLWVATNQATGAEVCVKLLVPESDTDGYRGFATKEAIERFRREAHAAAKLSHRAIVRVFDLLELDEKGASAGKGRPYAYGIVMELLQGETLGDLLAKRGKLPLGEALDILLPVVSALAHAHRASVIHRDIKPDNIFLAREPDGQVIPKVLDFGVSKLEGAQSLTSDGVALGTPTCMSPEQARGARVIDARSDVFSAGTLFYTMLSGQNPFEVAQSFASVLEAVIKLQVERIPDVPTEIWEVVERALQKDPAARWNDATEMGIALRKASGRRATTESMAHIATRPRSPSNPDLDAVVPLKVDDASSGDSHVLAASTPPPPLTVRNRTIVAVVIGTCLALLVAALTTVLWPADTKPSSTKSDPTAATPPAAATTVPSTAASSAPVATPTPPPAASSAHPSDVEGAPSATAAPVRSAAPSLKRIRKPGQDNIARDPGF